MGVHMQSVAAAWISGTMSGEGCVGEGTEGLQSVWADGDGGCWARHPGKAVTWLKSHRGGEGLGERAEHWLWVVCCWYPPVLVPTCAAQNRAGWKGWDTQTAVWVQVRDASLVLGLCELMPWTEIFLSGIRGGAGAVSFTLTSRASSLDLLGAFWAYALHYCGDLSWIALGSVSAQSTSVYIENRITFYFSPQEANRSPQSRI